MPYYIKIFPFSFFRESKKEKEMEIENKGRKGGKEGKEWEEKAELKETVSLVNVSF